MNKIHQHYDLHPKDFFEGIFPFSYFCAMKDFGQIGGNIPSLELPGGYEESIKHYELFILELQKLNSQGYNIFFTPNGVQNVGGKNSLNNFQNINAWYIDIDIQETKNLDYGLLEVRQEKKADILGYIFDSDFWPSLVVETRNGFQLYWFAKGNLNIDNWHKIEKGIYEKFEKYGADKSTTKIVQLMRVPGFRYYKHGETGIIDIIWPLSTFWLYEEMEMLGKFPAKEEKVIEEKRYEVFTINTFKNINDIFDRVIAMPVDQVLAKISGTDLVRYEKIEISRDNTEKTPILSNGRPTPNWINRKLNKVFSNTEDGFCNIIHYLQYYGWTKYEIAKRLKELFKIQ